MRCTKVESRLPKELGCRELGRLDSRLRVVDAQDSCGVIKLAVGQVGLGGGGHIARRKEGLRVGWKVSIGRARLQRVGRSGQGG